MHGSPLRIAFAGSTDLASPWLLRALSRGDAQFVAVCESDEGRAERAAADYRARWPHHDLAAMLAETRPQGVIVAAPWSQRPEIIRRCLAFGASVASVGLPALPALRAPKNLAAVWSACPARFSPAGRLLERMVRSGRFGPMVSIALSAAQPRESREADDAAWPVSRDLLFDLCDLLLEIAGPPRELFSRGHPDGALHALAISRDDVPISLTVTQSGRPEGESMLLDIRGADGSRLTLDGDMQLKHETDRGVVRLHAPAFARSDPSLELGWLGWLNEFLLRCRAPRAGAAERLTGSDWRPAAAVVDALLAGLTRRAPVSPAGAGREKRRRTAGAVA